MDDDAVEERRRLEAAAYGRGAAPTERETALARLRELDARVLVADAPPAPAPTDDPFVPRSARRRRIAIGAVAAVVLAGAIVYAAIPKPPQSSLSVFDRDQTSDDLRDAELLDGASPATAESVRALSSGDRWIAFAYRDPAHQVCMGLVTAGALSLRCVSPSEFSRHGVGITADFIDSSTTEKNGVFHWGPTGDMTSRIGLSPTGAA